MARAVSILIVFAVLALASPARAVVLGGGLADTDCTVGFDGVDATDGASGVVCTDGDPACDADGVADGTCRFAIRVCTRLHAADCAPRDVTTIADAGISFDAPALSGRAACGEPEAVTVGVGSAVGATLIARDGDALKDVDYLNLCCRSAEGPFDAAVCALAVDATVACRHAIPPAFDTTIAKARALVAQAAADPTTGRRSAKRALRVLRRLRAISRKLAKAEPCGNALGLVATHAIDVLRAALRAS